MLRVAYARCVYTCSGFKFQRGVEGDTKIESDGEKESIFLEVEISNLNIFDSHNCKGVLKIRGAVSSVLRGIRGGKGRR